METSKRNKVFIREEKGYSMELRHLGGLRERQWKLVGSLNHLNGVFLLAFLWPIILSASESILGQSPDPPCVHVHLLAKYAFYRSVLRVLLTSKEPFCVCMCSRECLITLRMRNMVS